MQSNFLLSQPRPLLEAVTISHIACISNDRIIVTINSLQTKVFNHIAPRTRPFKENNWEEVAHLTEVDGQRILCSLVGNDYFILSNDQWHFYMFDMVGYRILDKGYIKNYMIVSMLEIADHKVAFGHQFGLISLWETSKRHLKVEELENVRKIIHDNEHSQLDSKELVKHNIQASKLVA